MMAKMKKVFISHPLYSEGDVAENVIQADEVCRELLEQGYLPISPIHLFGYMEGETPKIRNEIMDVCRRLIKMCDEVWVYGTLGGCAIEKRWAEQCRIPVIDMTKTMERRR